MDLSKAAYMPAALARITSPSPYACFALRRYLEHESGQSLCLESSHVFHTTDVLKHPIDQNTDQFSDGYTGDVPVEDPMNDIPKNEDGKPSDKSQFL